MNVFLKGSSVSPTSFQGVFPHSFFSFLMSQVLLLPATCNSVKKKGNWIWLMENRFNRSSCSSPNTKMLCIYLLKKINMIFKRNRLFMSTERFTHDCNNFFPCMGKPRIVKDCIFFSSYSLFVDILGWPTETPNIIISSVECPDQPCLTWLVNPLLVMFVV